VLISPPFLPERHDGETDADYVARAMTGDAPGEGAYPISQALGWHGGLHLIAPTSPTVGREPVRAIADGTVVYMREADPKAAPTTPAADDPLNYGNGWTSNGAVVIQHETEIGEGDTARVSFYSIYLHLINIDIQVVKKGQPIYRKDRIGDAGYLDGDANKIHFEIICDDANLAKLIGRSRGPLPTQQHGRTDAVYGQAYYALPVGTPIYGTDLRAAQRALQQGNAHDQAVAATRYAELKAAPPAQTTADPLFVGIEHSQGTVTTTTWLEDGTAVGTPIPDPDGEYRLYDDATALYPQSPSAGYALLRWGRLLGPDAINPADASHWRPINTPSGPGWVDLAPDAIQKFSDADFPHWRGWTLIDDSADGDSRCDSPTVRDLFEKDKLGRINPKRAMEQMAEPAIRDKLQTMIAKFPTEWEKATSVKRWDWLMGDPDDIADVLTEPMSQADFDRREKHLEALCFWEDANLGIDAKHWHFSPRAFIRHFRMCGWLSANEFKQLLPSHAIRTATQNQRTVTLWESIPDDNVNDDRNPTLRNHRIPLNKALRKYGITTPKRQASFFGNALQETSWLGGLAEFHGSRLWYAPWYGRGFLQLTNPENYCNYWVWRGRAIDPTLRAALVAAYKHIAGLPAAQRSNASLQDSHFPALTQQIIDWRTNVQAAPAQRGTEELLTPSDSAGFYWVKNRMATYSDQVHILERISVATDQGQKVYYRSQAFWRASAAVNLPAAVSRTNYSGLNGFDSRCCAYGAALATLSEVLFPDANGNLLVEFPQGYFPRKK
jgi:murein DD-endopeptidase MepM/ murein hydrolase activator NlpD/predicted chitinase